MKSPETMSIRQLAAQCIIEAVHEEFFTTDEEYREKRIHLVSREGIGGICVFKGNLERTSLMISELQEASAVPLFVSADFEYGLPMRLDNGTSFPHAMALGKGNDLPRTFRVAQCIAREAKAVGVNWNFAPVCDINSNPDNPIINIRSFGATPDVVAAHAEAFAAGLQQERVLACAKHFPGHGDTAVDSHISVPVLTMDGDRLRSFELQPFAKTIEAGVKSVMTGHLAVPALDPSGTPASLSRILTTSLLREEMGFTGLIVTDALDMHAITDNYPDGEACVLALEAGADVLLMPEDPLQALDAIERAVESGRLSRERLIESVQRILDAKHWCGAIGEPKPAANPNKPPFDIDEHRQLALDAATAALTWYGDPSSLLPLTKYSSIAGFAVVQEESMSAATSFFTYVAQCYEADCHFAFIDESVSGEDIVSLSSGIDDAELLLIPVFIRARGYQGSVALPEKVRQAIEVLAAGRPVIALLFGNPYLHDSMPAQACLCAYSDSEGSLAAAAAELIRQSVEQS